MKKRKFGKISEISESQDGCLIDQEFYIIAATITKVINNKGTPIEEAAEGREGVDEQLHNGFADLDDEHQNRGSLSSNFERSP